jgi:hypothetical protein
MHFVIFGAARTGSSHLTQLLNGQKDILCHGGIFLSRNRNLYLRWPKKDLTAELAAELKNLRERAPIEFMRRVLDRNYECASVGFKFFGHHNPEILPTLLSDTSLRKILLFRQNVLAIYTSRLVSKATGRYGLRHDDVRTEPPRITFKGKQFLEFKNKYLSFCHSVIEELNRTGQNYFLMRYEDMNDPSMLGDAIAFLGIKPKRLKYTSNLVKENSPNILSRLANPDEALAFLREQGVAHWAFEGRTSLEPMAGVAEQDAAPALSPPSQESSLS